MKRLALIILSIALVALFSTSCSKDDDQPSFNENLIIGEWLSGAVHERYDLDYSGATWNTDDDVTEDEAQEFTWTITKDELEQIHITETGTALVPKVYTITNLTASSLVYEDSYGESTSFIKQEE